MRLPPGLLGCLLLAPAPMAGVAAATEVVIVATPQLENLRPPLISETGVVAFMATEPGVPGFGVFTGNASGGGFTPFVTQGDGIATFTVTINGDGQVSFSGSGLDGVTRSIYRGASFDLRFADVAFPEWSPIASGRNGWYALNRASSIVVGQLDSNAGPSGEWRQPGSGSEIPHSGVIGRPLFVSDLGVVAYRTSGLNLMRGPQLIANPSTSVRYLGATFSMNGFGDLVFGGTGPGESQSAIWLAPRGSTQLTKVAGSDQVGSPQSPSIADNGRVAFQAVAALYLAADPIAARVIGQGDPLDGSTIQSLQVSNQALNSAGEIAFLATLEDGRHVIAVARAQTPTADVHWNAPGGGVFDDPNDWLEQEVPSAARNQNAVFDIPASSYLVDLGFQEVNRLEVRSGAPTFSGGALNATALTLDPPSLRVDGVLELVNANLVAVHVGIGTGPGTDPAGLVLTSSQSGLTASGRLSVQGGLLTIQNGALVSSAEGRIGAVSGAASPEVVLGGDGSRWDSGSLAVGLDGGVATLSIEDGADVVSQVGSIGGPACSRCAVEVRGAPLPATRSTWTLESLEIGATGAGELLVEDGGTVVVSTGGVDVGGFGVGTVRVSGVANTTPGSRSEINSLGPVTLGSNAPGELFIDDGGALSFLAAPGQFLLIGSTASATVRVEGVHAGSGLPSQIALADEIAVGLFQPGSLVILDGAEVTSRLGTVGSASVAGTGSVVIGTALAPTTWSISEQLTVGGGPTGSTGEILLLDGVIGGNGDLIVEANGSIRGRGEILGTGTAVVRDGGVIEAGLLVAGSGAGSGAGSNVAGPTAGSLRVEPSIVFEPGSTLLVEVAGLAPGVDHGEFVVDGDLVLSGTTTLRFQDGFAPIEGDELAFLSIQGALDMTGARFAIEHLAPGFEFDVAPVAGQLTLTALNDGIYVPEPRADLLAAASLCVLALVARCYRSSSPSYRPDRRRSSRRGAWAWSPRDRG